MPTLQVDHLSSCNINSGNYVGLCTTSISTSLNLVQQLLCLHWETHYTHSMLNALTEKGRKAKRENHCNFVQTHYNSDPSDFKVTVIELVSSQAQASLPVGLPAKLLYREGSHLIMHAGDTCQAGLFPQLIFFHNLPCMLNLIILAPGQTATAFSWCIQYQRPWSQE